MKTLMIVDDEELIRQKLASLLDWKEMGVQIVAQAGDGAEGERLILLKQPDMVITDVVMPGQTGLEMIAAVKDKTQAKFVILSGYQDFGYVQEALRLGAADYVLKPIQAAELQKTMLTVLGRLPQEEESRRYGEIVAKVLALVAEELSDPELTLKSLCANQLFMNETYVSRLFQKRVGQKFSAYVTACRMEKAQQILVIHPDVPIGEVARRVGFDGDGKYFSEVFKKATGLTPAQFRSRS